MWGGIARILSEEEKRKKNRKKKIVLSIEINGD